MNGGRSSRRDRAAGGDAATTTVPDARRAPLRGRGSTRSSASRPDCRLRCGRDEDLVRVEQPQRIVDREQQVVVADEPLGAYAAGRTELARYRAQALLGGPARSVVRGPPLEPPTERGRDDEHLEPATVRAAGDNVPDRRGAGSSVSFATTSRR